MNTSGCYHSAVFSSFSTFARLSSSQNFFKIDYKWKYLVTGFFALIFHGSAVAQSNDSGSMSAASIFGEIKITRHLSQQRMRFRIYPGYRSVPPPPADSKRQDEWQNVVVYLNAHPSLELTENLNETEAQIEQLGETFIPHVLPIVKGTAVEFPNQDSIFHNVFSLSATKTFDLGRYPKGDSRSVQFDEPGIVPIFCHLHSDMSAVILVLDNSYFSVPDTKGHFSIKNIPPGTYTVVVWHERSERVEHQVELQAGQQLELNLTVPIEDDDP